MNSIPYTRFAVAKEKLWKGMPDREIRVLKTILAQDPNNPLMVKDLINTSALGSPATIHAALTSLVNSGHLKHATLPSAGRSKFIYLTPISKTLFKKLNLLLLACAKT